VIPLNVERIKKYTLNTAVWLFMRDPKTLNEIEQEDLAQALQSSAQKSLRPHSKFPGNGPQARR
jgi:hypothetical protein